jgi:hypothetical protein
MAQSVRVSVRDHPLRSDRLRDRRYETPAVIAFERVVSLSLDSRQRERQYSRSWYLFWNDHLFSRDISRSGDTKSKEVIGVQSAESSTVVRIPVGTRCCLGNLCAETLPPDNFHYGPLKTGATEISSDHHDREVQRRCRSRGSARLGNRQLSRRFSRATEHGKSSDPDCGKSHGRPSDWSRPAPVTRLCGYGVRFYSGRRDNLRGEGNVRGLPAAERSGDSAKGRTGGDLAFDKPLEGIIEIQGSDLSFADYGR